MSFFFLIPIALLMGIAGLFAFMWALKSGQYDDLDGAAARVLIEEDTPEGDRICPPSPSVRTSDETITRRRE